MKSPLGINLPFLSHTQLGINFHYQSILGNSKNQLQISTIEVNTVHVGFQFTAASKVR